MGRRMWFWLGNWGEEGNWFCSFFRLCSCLFLQSLTVEEHSAGSGDWWANWVCSELPLWLGKQGLLGSS